MRRLALAAFAFLLVAIQFIPYGRNHTNPPVTAAVAWDSRATESLVRGACFDCHSNETRWPWYSHVAPASWLVQSDVNEGRTKLDFSEGNLKEIDEVEEVVSEGEMPPWFYRLAHREAWLSAEEKQALVNGLRATFADRAGKERKQKEPGEHNDHD
jgi:mono/diheme cytochrome c family protein